MISDVLKCKTVQEVCVHCVKIILNYDCEDCKLSKFCHYRGMQSIDKDAEEKLAEINRRNRKKKLRKLLK